jgi:hypothetical protein
MDLAQNLIACLRCPQRQAHAVNLACACTVDGADITAHARADYCPRPNGPRFGGVKPDGWIEGEGVPVESSGAVMWRELHEYTPGDGSAAWLAAFNDRVPCGECKREWKAWQEQNPPNFSSVEAWRLWTWAAHNAVNARIGAPQVEYVEAARLCGWST